MEKINLKNNNSEDDLAKKIRFFHDQKHNDFNTKNCITNAGGNESRGNFHFNEKQRITEKIGNGEKLKERITDLVSTINNINFQDDNKPSKEQILLLTKKQKITKQLIHDVLRQIPRYLDDVRETEDIVEKQKNSENSNGDLAQTLQEASRRRRGAHDILIQNIKIAERYIRNNFGQLDENALKAWEDDEKKHGRETLNIKKIKFENNIICPVSVNMGDRHQIADWARQMYDVLSILENSI